MSRVAYAVVGVVALVFLGLFLNGGFNSFFNSSNWEDLRSPASQIRLGGANPATSVSYRGGDVISFAKNVNQYVYVDCQMPHSWDEGTDVVAHIHWTIPVSGANGVNAENVKWDITYSWANINGVFPSATSGSVTVDVRSVSSDTHLLSNWATISGAGKTASSMLIISVKRDTGVDNNYNNAVYLVEFDIHFRQDRFGSPSV